MCKEVCRNNCAGSENVKRTGLYKNKFFKLLFAVTITAFVALAIFTILPGLSVEAKTTSIADMEAEAKAMSEKLKANEEKITALENKISSLKNQADKANELKEELDRQIQYMQENIEDTKTLISKYNVMIAAKESDVATLNTSLSERYGIFLDKMRLSYENGNQGYLELLLDSENLIDFITRIERIGNLLSYEKELIDSIDSEAADLEAAKNAVAEEKAKAEELRASQEKMEKDLEKKSKEQEALIKKINSDAATAEANRLQMIKENEALNKEIEEKLKEIAAQQASAYVGGTYIWPLDSSYKKISSSYSNRVLNGIAEFHRGIDIPAPTGTPIYAANDGTVITANDWTVKYSSYGNYIIIDHGGGKATLYAHCSKLLVSVGDKVKQGDKIGLVGTTGRVTGAHVHFEVRVNGVTTNPFVPGMLKFNNNGTWVDPTDGYVTVYG